MGSALKNYLTSTLPLNSSLFRSQEIPSGPGVLPSYASYKTFCHVREKNFDVLHLIVRLDGRKILKMHVVTTSHSDDSGSCRLFPTRDCPTDIYP
ncbi:hypothetical protein EVAR_10101_1 [Eumeta japonica]|uniref:Uncharacterized protein n=1 Tax=Eumeta variegata TaxID=151549 RepID=A0A4C1UCY8_EUMVA|nr:hypothetical protein EVAR_10101_1 [Eumeta japonica]